MAGSESGIRTGGTVTSGQRADQFAGHVIEVEAHVPGLAQRELDRRSARNRIGFDRTSELTSSRLTTGHARCADDEVAARDRAADAAGPDGIDRSGAVLVDVPPVFQVWLPAAASFLRNAKLAPPSVENRIESSSAAPVCEQRINVSLFNGYCLPPTGSIKVAVGRAFTVKPPLRLPVPAAVVTETSRAPVGALGLIVMSAVSVVSLMNVTDSTVMPAPKLAVAESVKFVPRIATLSRVCPAGRYPD